MKNYKDIKTFENACEYLGLEPNTVIPDLSCFPEKHRKAIGSNAKLILIAEAINTISNNGKEWFPDWNNSKEYKYFPWFEIKSPASGFSCIDCGDWFSHTYVGSRLCFRTSDIAKYVGTQFEDLYNDSFDKYEVVEEPTSLDGETVNIKGIEYTLKIKK